MKKNIFCWLLSKHIMFARNYFYYSCCALWTLRSKLYFTICCFEFSSLNINKLITVYDYGD